MSPILEESDRQATLPEAAQGARSGLPLVVDEKPICRGAFALHLSRACGAPACIEAGGLEEAVRQAAAARPPLTLVDLITINHQFSDLRRIVSAAAPGPVIVVDDRFNPTFAGLAKEAGARGYVDKQAEGDQLTAALTEVLAGADHFPGAAVAPPPASQGGALSARQTDVLEQIALGKTNREIGEALNITPGTVKLHIHAILKLTGARNRTEAALSAGRLLAGRAGSSPAR